MDKDMFKPQGTFGDVVKTFKEAERKARTNTGRIEMLEHEVERLESERKALWKYTELNDKIIEDLKKKYEKLFKAYLYVAKCVE